MSQKNVAAYIDKMMDDGAKLAPEELLFSYKGVLYPSAICSPEAFKAIEFFKARNDDIFLSGYLKTGTNWVGQILTDLVKIASKKGGESNNLDDDEELGVLPYLELGYAVKYQSMASLPFRRVIRTHLLPQSLPPSLFESKAKILLLLRNPKDVATSFYHFVNGLTVYPSYNSWDEFIIDFMNGENPWGSYFDHVFEWNKYADDENVMAITYEELKENRALGVKRISDFLELHLTEEEIQSVVERSSFQAMKENSTKTHGSAGKYFFRKGDVRDWKYLFNEEQNEKMELMFEERLSGTKLGKKMKYEVYCKP